MSFHCVQDMTMNPGFGPNRALFWNPKVNPKSAEAFGLIQLPPSLHCFGTRIRANQLFDHGAS